MNRMGSLRIMAALFVTLCISGALSQVTTDQRRRIEGALPEKATAEPARQRRVLIWNTPFMEQSPHKGYTIPQAEYAMKRLGEKTGAFVPVVSDDIALLLPENIGHFDAILLNNANGKWIRPAEEDMGRLNAGGRSIDDMERVLRESLLGWVGGGGGIVAWHHAVGGNTHWPEFLEMLGAGYWGHPWNEEVGVRVEEPGHPLVRAFGGEDFRIAEEIFQFKEPYSREKVRVLLSLDTAKTNMTVPWIHREDGDFALAWIREYGQGRVFYCAIGHRTEHWWNPAILGFYLDGIQWAMGDLEGDATPSAEVAAGDQRGGDVRGDG